MLTDVASGGDDTKCVRSRADAAAVAERRRVTRAPRLLDDRRAGLAGRALGTAPHELGHIVQQVVHRARGTVAARVKLGHLRPDDLAAAVRRLRAPTPDRVHGDSNYG